jgi:hypothetical protein
LADTERDGLKLEFEAGVCRLGDWTMVCLDRTGCRQNNVKETRETGQKTNMDTYRSIELILDAVFDKPDLRLAD